MTVKNYVLDINKTSLQHPSIVLRQDDYNIYTVNISVTENGVPVNLGSYTLNFLGITPAGAKIIDSKNFITTPADLAVGKFSYRFPKEAAGSKGVYDVAYFRLKTTSGATSTIDLNLRVLGGIDLTADEVKDYITVDDTLRNTLTNEVFKKVDAKVDEHLATVKKGDKGDKGDPGKDGVVDYSKTVNTTGDQTVAGTKTFSSAINGNLSGNASTADKLRTARTIGGVTFDGTADIVLPGVNTAGNQNTTGKAASADVLNTRYTTFTDFADVAGNMVTYSGNWRNGSTVIENSPVSGMTYMIIEVVPDSGGTAGIIRAAQYGNQKAYYNVVNGGKLGTWFQYAVDSNVVHLSGDETAAGFKKFSGNIATTSDNSMINGGGNNGDIALVKKNGTSGFLAVGTGNSSLRIKTSNNSAISPSDTFTDMFTVDKSGVVKAGTQQYLVPLDKNVVHNSSNETIAGDKTLPGNTTLATTTILAGNYGLRVTPSGFQKTTDGKTWVSANI